MEKKGIVLEKEFEKAILDLGFSEFTEIQEKCIPLIQQGKDVIGLSYTGSGKTAAFGFPTLEKVKPGKGIQLLVIVPTRELCNQVAKEFKKFTKYRRTDIVEIYGGVSYNPQISQLRYADVVVGTPGRLLDHIQSGKIRLEKINTLILDEADRMFDMGFIVDIKKITARLPECQKLLFSATMPHAIMEIVKNYMKNPVKIKMETYVDKSKLMQHYYPTTRRTKFSLLVHTIKNDSRGLVIVFCGTRHMVDAVGKNLNKQNIKSQSLHGGMTQSKRKRVMEDFHNGKLDVLVASDVAARGLDIKNVNLIVNYDIPKTSEEYVHRIGRTARAGREGKVISLLSPEDHEHFRDVMEDRSLLIHKCETPKFEQVEFVMSKGRSRDRDFRGRPKFGNHQRRERSWR
ncbi:MAG: DEAD/DEAH box helicase [Candidatus Nanoarchaeia archaeon]|nr:DEAD/DEAH box helicase [Candidatus Nanoarchaeia archaeon]